MKKLTAQFITLQKALHALTLIYQKPVDTERIYIDATIQRFEFTFELFWKTFNLFFETKGITPEFGSPKDILRIAYKQKLISDEHTLLSMLKDRNLSSHTYNEELADEIYARIQTYVPLLSDSFNILKTTIEKTSTH